MRLKSHKQTPLSRNRLRTNINIDVAYTSQKKNKLDSVEGLSDTTCGNLVCNKGCLPNRKQRYLNYQCVMLKGAQIRKEYKKVKRIKGKKEVTGTAKHISNIVLQVLTIGAAP